MTSCEDSEQMLQYYHQLLELRQKMKTLREKAGPQRVDEYNFATDTGMVPLSELFGDKDVLFVVHNMGPECSYCTLWADGFNGILDHLENRAAFVMSTPDTPDNQKKFAASRGWKFTMVSHQDTSFAEDMGYKKDGGFHPGVSVFRKTAEGVERVSHTPFGPGDDYCGLWHLFDLIPQGAEGWQPKLSY